MKTHAALLVLSAPALLLAGCAAPENTPLLFGQTQSVGISIGGSTTDQGIDFTLGYKDRNFAVVPVTVKQGNGNSTQIRSQATPGYEDALSVLGQFDVSSSTSTANVGLGKFFATGTAAKTLADGFKTKLAGNDARKPEATDAAKAAATRAVEAAEGSKK